MWRILLLLTASCSEIFSFDDVTLNDAGATGPGDGMVQYQLTSIEPSVANANDTIMLEGAFDQTAIVHFPGGTSQAATVLGPHRLSVTVPVSASAGDLTVTTGGAVVGPLRFRRASFSLGLGKFEANVEQADVGHQISSLSVARRAHSIAVIGRYVYLLGGVGNTSAALDSVERATISDDHTLGPFAIVAGNNLVTARYGHTCAVIGNYLYVIGGEADRYLNSVERAAINSDGTLSPFAIVPEVTLTTAHGSHASAVVGNFLYVLGGYNNGALNDVERATIAPNGTIGPFAEVPDITLAVARFGATSAVIGSYLYVVGGHATSGSLSSVERAIIHGDGSIGAFAVVADATLAAGRYAHTSTVIGNALYVVGGIVQGLVENVERSTINPDGSLGVFSVVPGGLMVTARGEHTSVIIGNYLYVFAGSSDSGGILSGVERATINTDGAIATFDTASGYALASASESHTSTVIGSYLYIFGGLGNTGLLSRVERATINDDGSLGAFAVTADVALNTARYLYAGAVIGNNIVAIGGTQAGGQKSNSVEQTTVLAGGSLSRFVNSPGGTLVTTRSGHTSAVVGNHLYVLGGIGGSAQSSIEQAVINSDGSLGPFASVSGVTLAVGRWGHTSALIGGYLYLFGGSATGGVLNSVERATINADGTLGQFAIVSGVTLTAARAYHASEVIGHYLYIIGGLDNNGPLGSVERAIINSDGSLGGFAPVAGVALTTARYGSTSTVIENDLYVIGGHGSSGELNSVERAVIGVSGG